MSFPLLELSLITIPIRKSLHSFSLPQIIIPFSLIHSISPIKHNPKPLSDPIDYLSSINSMIVFPNLKLLCLHYLLVIKEITFHFILFIHLVYIGPFTLHFLIHSYSMLLGWCLFLLKWDVICIIWINLRTTYVLDLLFYIFSHADKCTIFHFI